LVADKGAIVKIIDLEPTDWGETILKFERGHTVIVTDESGGISIPHDVLKRYKTRFFHIQVTQEGVILSPANLHLEIDEGNEIIPELPNEEK